MAVDRKWVGQVLEDPIEPELPIVDAHFHIWNQPPQRPSESYLSGDFFADRRQGHNIVAAVYVECNAYYRADGPPETRPASETLHIRAENERLLRKSSQALCSAIVGHADLSLGAAVDAVLEAHIDASPDCFRGIRHSTVWDEDDALRYKFVTIPRHLMLESAFIEGARCLARRGLTFDAWLYHPQLNEVANLARNVPNLKIIVDHLGGPLGVGAYAQDRALSVSTWAAALQMLAQFPNVYLKLGGLAMKCAGLNLREQPMPPRSIELAAITRDTYDRAIEIFGPDRCMFESNFPVDKEGLGYGVLWNSFKRITTHYSPSERARMFNGVAREVYRLEGAA